MTYNQKCDKFRDLIHESNGMRFPPEPRWVVLPEPIRCRWKNIEELKVYLESWGGGIIHECRKREGYLVVDLEEGLDPIGDRPHVVVEVPTEFAMKVFVLGVFP